MQIIPPEKIFKEILSLSEAAEFLGMSEKNLREYCRKEPLIKEAIVNEKGKRDLKIFQKNYFLLSKLKKYKLSKNKNLSNSVNKEKIEKRIEAEQKKVPCVNPYKGLSQRERIKKFSEGWENVKFFEKL